MCSYSVIITKWTPTGRSGPKCKVDIKLVLCRKLVAQDNSQICFLLVIMQKYLTAECHSWPIRIKYSRETCNVWNVVLTSLTPCSAGSCGAPLGWQIFLRLDYGCAERLGCHITMCVLVRFRLHLMHFCFILQGTGSELQPIACTVWVINRFT